MTDETFVRFIVENKIGTGKEIDARNMFKMMDKGNKHNVTPMMTVQLVVAVVAAVSVVFIDHEGAMRDACCCLMHTLTYKITEICLSLTDKNGVMEFEEFVLILVLPKTTEEITAEQFATCMPQNIIVVDVFVTFLLTRLLLRQYA